MRLLKGKNFCDLGPVCYWISEKKEIARRCLQDRRAGHPFARQRQPEPLPNLVARRTSPLIKTGKGIDPVLQENKAVNIGLACQQLHGLVIHPGEEFSFWQAVGKVTRRRGYRDGRVLLNHRLVAGLGGGLCNLANTINWLVLHSPLEITEFHSHSDALAPDHGVREPFSSGTSVSYNYIDYRFCNHTDQAVQLLLWCENGQLIGELRSEVEFPCRYELVEEDHHFEKQQDGYYRISRIYQDALDRATGQVLAHKLVRNNHSLVMFEVSQIPPELIRPAGGAGTAQPGKGQ